MNITAKIKIATTPEIIATIKVFKVGLQYCVDTAWANNIKNNIKLHPLVYKHLKALGLQSQLAISCIKQSCGLVKRAKSKPVINHTSIKYNFPRSASYKNNILSLATLSGRVKIPFNIPVCYQQYFNDWSVCESILYVNKKQQCFFCFTFSKDINATKFVHSQNNILGIDVGVNNLAVTSDGKFYNSKKVKQVKRKFQFLRGELQSVGTRSAQKLLKRLSGREQRFMTWVNHNISKSIVNNFGGSKIVLEDLKGIRKHRRGKRLNSMLSNWSFFQLQSFISYKAEMMGVEVVKVKPNYTSQICSRCGELGFRSKHFFSCHCGFQLNADLNASRNLAHPMLVVRQVAVTRPYIQSDDIKGTSRSAIAIELMDNTHLL
jgi:IS605 OrfB family transposase